MTDIASGVPGIMVSSTFFDLRQIREDLRRFIGDELGYRALLSEHPSFPIDPDATTVENCRRRVLHDADILVLIIGRRYGSIGDHSDKSVTNLEFLAARAKGIPVYAFVESGLLNVLPVWHANPTADFSKEVDTPRLFEFLEFVRTTSSTWTNEFRYAQDIVDALRMQFAYQHGRGLRRERQLREATASCIPLLTGETLRLALEQPPAWEYLFFASALTDATRRHDHLRRRHELSLPIGPGEDIDEPMNWIRARFADARRFAGTATELLGAPLQRALGPPGEPTDLDALWFITETLGELYRDGLVWGGRLRTANVDARFQRLLQIIARMIDDFAAQIYAFGPHVREQFQTALAAHQPGQETVLKLPLVISVPAAVLQEYETELERLQRGSR